ncbi:cellulase family glycosylhydrolase [uncultured Tenacibaculum sp.]|uniref:cellulase family glycosylhydrolase n=1 Tax=uncultured Tenacibaculum sp. TaxID=174713 RepID=UPI002613143A|nr:cellulase family glycosylhydrolase [uncultured Tenacibaculum sp.]
MEKIKQKIIVLLGFLLSLIVSGQEQNWLSVSGNKLFDSRGQEVRLTGVNWFGFETQNYFPHGIWTRDMKSVLQQIKDLGFNTIRVPWCNEMLDPGATIDIPSYGSDAYTGISPMNEEETNITSPIELLDVFVQWCQDNDMKIVLDNHSRAADGFLNEAFWYTTEYSEERWINDWIFMAERYKNFSAVVGMDLNNEPHGSSWGNSNPLTDWNKAAERCGNAILNVNPNVLIIVEGVGEFEGNSYWWGGQLMGARQYPIQLTDQSKLMYSAHEYGPEVSQQDWFETPDFPQNMPGIWEENYGYLYDNGTSPLFIGEFGIKEQDAFGGIAYTWFTEFVNFMGSRYSWTFWSMNPNSGDTGGILQDNWSSVNQWKLDVLTPHLAPFIPNVINGNGGGGNTAPVANVTANITAGVAPVTIQFDGSNSTDIDGDTLIYSWNFDDGSSGTGVIINHEFTQAGDYNVILTVSDGSLQDTVAITISVSSNTPPTGCEFNTPINTALPSVNTTFNHVFVLGNGPDLSNVNDITINWDLTNNGLWQFSMNTNNGSPSWWVDFLPKITQSFSQSQPEITIANSGFSGLDGSYWVTLDGGNLVLVSKNNGFTIYCSTTDSKPNCETNVVSRSINTIPQTEVFSIGPNPASELISLSIPVYQNLDAKRELRLLNINGQVVKYKSFNKQQSINIPISNLAKGIYFLKINNEDSGAVTIQKIIKE